MLDSKFAELGVALMDTVAGPHFTFILPKKLSRDNLISHALRMIGLFEAKGVSKKRVVISVRSFSLQSEHVISLSY